MNTNQEQQLIQKCLALIEEKIGWGSSENWHSKVFEELSVLIHLETNVLLSSTTLKRIWGKLQYESKPSISTLNALSKFAGYLNWRDFKTNYSSTPDLTNNKRFKRQAKIFSYAACIAIIFITLFSVIRIKPEHKKDFDYSKINFESKPVTLGLPNTVVFNLDLKNLESDSIYIQQYWDESKTIRLKQGQQLATGQYYYPGYFRAKLLVDGTIIKEHDLFIKSGGWLGTIDYEPIPKYFTENEVIDNNLRLSNSEVQRISSRDNPIISSLHIVNDFGNISGDNFELKTSLKSLFTDKWAVCQKTTVVIIGTKSALMIPFSIPGCTSEIGIMLSEKYKSGKQHNLSKLGTDLSVFKPIKILVKDKTLKIFINGSEVYTDNYKSSIGNIAGIRFRFLGAGEVDFIELKNLLTRESIIKNDF